MQQFVSIGILGIIQLVVDICLIGMFVVLIRQSRSERRRGNKSTSKDYENTVEEILQEGKHLAQVFEKQIKEKQAIIKRLNEGLDARIIGLNLLMNRADTVLKYGNMEKNGEANDMCALQDRIILMADKGAGPEEISKKLGISRGEVEMVVSLKRKLNDMEIVESRVTGK